VAGQTPEFLCHVKGTSDEPPSVLNNTCLDNQKSLCERIEFLEAPDSFAKEVSPAGLTSMTYECEGLLEVFYLVSVGINMR